MDRRVAPLLLLSACLWIGPAEHDARLDADGDGVPVPSDCDDTTDLVSPRVAEIPCDGLDNDCDPGTPDGPASIEGRAYGSVADALDAAIVGDTIELCTGTFAEAVVVDESVTLMGAASGADTVLDATGLGSPVVTVRAANVTLRNLTLTGGVGSSAGGGVDASEANGPLTLEGVIVSGNRAVTGAGVAGPVDGDVRITSSVIRDNTASGSAGGVLLHDDAYLSDTTVSDNVAATSGGGVVVGDGAVVSADVNTRISGNSAADGGGAWLGNGVTWTSGEFQGNVASGQGGGIYVSQGTLAVAVIRDNAAARGGGVAIVGRLDQCEITDNQAEDGAGVYAGGDLFVNGGLVESNVASGRGGGALVTQGSLVIEQNTLVRYNAAALGGGLAAFDGALDLLEVTLTENVAQTSGGGAHIESTGACPVVAGCLSILTSVDFVDNEATSQGGGLWTNHPATVSGCEFRANDADEGGGIHVDDPGLVTLSSATLTGNSANRGGGLHLRSSATSIVNNGALSGNNGDGAAIYVSAGEITATNVRFTDNFAPGDGAITLAEPVVGTNRFSSTLCEYNNNTSSDLKVEIGYDAEDFGPVFGCEYALASPSCN